MNKAYEDIYILGYNWLNPGQVTMDLSTVYREDTKILPSQTDLEATLPAPAAEVVDNSGAQQTNVDSIGDSPDYSDDSVEYINVDNSYLETQASNILQDNNQLEERISNISQYISRMQQYIKDNFIAAKNKQDQQQLNINELQQENIKLNKMNENYVNRIAKLETTQTRLKVNVKSFQDFVGDLSNEAVAVVEQHAPEYLQTTPGSAAAVAIISAVAKIADAPAEMSSTASPATTTAGENKSNQIKSNKFIVVPQRHQRFLHIYRNNLYNCSIQYIKSYKIDTFSNIIYSSLLSKLFSR